MHALFSLRPRTLLPITSLEEERILSSLPGSTPPLIGHPLVESRGPVPSEQQHNPYTHRFRRKLLLRQKKRLNSSLGLPFNLEHTVRQALHEVDEEELCLVNFASTRSVSHYLSGLPLQRSQGPTVPTKFQRKPHVVVDEARLERRRVLAQQRLTELPQTLAKLQQVQQRMQMMQTWIVHEDELAIRNLSSAMETSNQSQNSTAPTGSQNSPRSMTSYSGMKQNNTNTEKRANDDTKAKGLTQGYLDQSGTSVPNRDSLSSNSESIQKETGTYKSADRYSLSSAFSTKVQARTEQLREIVRKSESQGPQHVMTSADMERYLATTTHQIETLVDKQVDPVGKLWTMEELIFGDIHNKRSTCPIVSSFSGRTLKPIIRQDYETEPRKLSLLREIATRFHMALPEWIAPAPSPIEYRYLRPYMLFQVNKLLRDNFWANIDVSESLLYPEHTVVVLYKELVIACGFINTLGYITYICVHPEWRHAGIAKFMLYHLIQTCPGKDITLHVSTNNTAALKLYTKFCFQCEEQINNFYNQFIPAHDALSKDAFFMRLRR